MRKVVVLAFLLMALLTACGSADVPDQEADTGLTVTVYYSPT